MNTQQHIHKNISTTFKRKPNDIQKLNYDVAKTFFAHLIVHIVHLIIIDSFSLKN